MYVLFNHSSAGCERDVYNNNERQQQQQQPVELTLQTRKLATPGC